MAYDQLHKRTAKCSISRKGPNFTLRLWYTFLISMISLPSIMMSCYPNGSIDVRYGNPLELYCSRKNTSGRLDILHGSQVVTDTTRVNDTTIKLYIEKPNMTSATYSCKTDGETCFFRVLVDLPPRNVTDFKCVSNNLIYLNCSWTAPIKFALIKYELKVLVNNDYMLPCEVKVANIYSHYCVWTSVKDANYTIYREAVDIYYFKLIAKNRFGSLVQDFEIDHYSVVKPGAPTNVRVITKMTKSHSVLLQWEIPSIIAHLLKCGVEHRMEYQIAKIDSTDEFRSVNVTGLSNNNITYKFWLKNLPYAHMQYEVRIYIRSKKAIKEEFWSDYNYTIFFTASERPRRPPDLITGAFTETQYDLESSSYRNIMVYWRQLEEYEEAGENFTYKVYVTRNNKTEIKYPNKTLSLSYITLDKIPKEPMQISVASSNVNGSSINSSHIYIPPEVDRNLKVTRFTQIAYEGGIYRLSWVTNENTMKMDNYTLLWCQHNITKICSGRLNFKVLNGDLNNYKINVTNNYRYQFAISANKGMATSGIVWATCDMSKDTLEVYSFPVSIQTEHTGKSFVAISWSFSCELNQELNTIKGYNITYCIGVKTHTECDPTYNSSSIIINDLHQMKLNITGLRPFKTYLFTVSLVTIYGTKKIPTIRSVTTVEDTPTPPRNIKISDVESNSFVLSFDPPDPRNGIIGNYTIYCNGVEPKVVEVESDSNDVYRRNVTLTNLDPYTNYTCTVKACNIGIKNCSQPAPQNGIFVRTRIGAPSQIQTVNIHSKPDYVTWDLPQVHGGHIDYFEIRRTIDGKKQNIERANNLSYNLMLCYSVQNNETFEIRGVNLDNDYHHGVIALDETVVTIPMRSGEKVLQFAGEWSRPFINTCTINDNTTVVVVILIGIALICIGYGCLKLYNMYKNMDIKPVMPEGLLIPGSEKCGFETWNTINKDNKLSLDETLPLTNTKAVVVPPDVKQKDNSNCNSSNQTESSGLSDNLYGNLDRQPSTSDDDSNASFNLDDGAKIQHFTKDDEYSFTNSDDKLYHDSFNEKPFIVDSQPVLKPSSGYVQSVPTPLKHPTPKLSIEPSNSSYVKAGLSPEIFTTGVLPPIVKNHPPTSSGYVLREDVMNPMNLHKLVPSVMPFGPESLPSTPNLPHPTKQNPNSYIQLQSLDTLPSLKPTERNIVPSMKPTAAVISPGDPVINKHLSNVLSASQLADDPPVLDPAMSANAYCRFSWNTDPANDNLKTFYSPTSDSYNN
ncbi:cytokine receptor [Achroia grisella]|uniref:cytokine receptor n=1 Tax=Achroia grisella TaxID=688607 RepID=UPI0027D2A368|nr:cytokine receptor [Achroia grisella]